MNSIEGAKVDFDHKYKYIGLYFKGKANDKIEVNFSFIFSFLKREDH